MALTEKAQALPDDIAGADGIDVRCQEATLKTGALQNAIPNSANSSGMATDEIDASLISSVGAQPMLRDACAEVLNKVTPADIFDFEEVIARANAPSVESGADNRAMAHITAVVLRANAVPCGPQENCRAGFSATLRNPSELASSRKRWTQPANSLPVSNRTVVQRGAARASVG